MTREEAIKILSKETSMEKVNELNYYAGFSRDKVVGLIQEAMEMGAKALEKQDVPDTNVGSKWIPCSERLPNDIAIHEVTAKFSNGTIYTEFAYYDESREEWWKFDDDGIVNVIAWKEHSEPYKEGET